MRSLFLLTPLELLWTAIGVILTIVGTLLQLSVPETVPWVGGYTFSFQVGGVLLTACLGGSNAGVYAQVVYLTLGLTGFQVFSYGGGLDYLHQPAFGYLLGFLPGAWVCGSLAFRQSGPSSGSATLSPPGKRSINLRVLGSAALMGLVVMHLTGITYLLVRNPWDSQFLHSVELYSGYTLPGQLLVTTVVVLLAVIFRRLTFY